jgi:hypothetical protein
MCVTSVAHFRALFSPHAAVQAADHPTIDREFMMKLAATHGKT